MKESAFQQKIIKKLQKRGAYVINIWGNGFMKAGIPDLIVCYKGYFIALELKTEISRPSPLQLAHINLITKADGKALLLRPKNEEDLWNLLEEIDGKGNI